MKNRSKNLVLTLMLFLSFFSLHGEEMIIKTSDGVDLHVTVKGEGIPCLYVHGGPGSGAYWMEYFAGDILEKRFQMIYLDQRGVSRSSTPENGDYSPQRMAQDFEEVRKALGIEKWLTFGHSFGGILQMAYNEHSPESIMGMLMVNCSLSFDQAVDNLMNYALELTNSKEDKSINDPEKPKLDRAFAAIGKAREMDVWWKMHYDDRAHYDKMEEVMGSIKDWNYDFSGKAIFMT
jgi:proline iminopeptidase